MDIKTRVGICKILLYAHHNYSFAERVGITDVSYYKNSCKRTEDVLNEEERMGNMGLFGKKKRYDDSYEPEIKDDFDDEDDYEGVGVYRTYEEYLESGEPIDPCDDALWLHDQED